jgi:fructan beta-fructosidase
MEAYGNVHLFKLKVGTTNEEKWVLCINPGAPNGGSGTQYFIGDYDGTHFKTDQDIKWIDNGLIIMPV